MNINLIELIYLYSREEKMREAAQIRLASLVRAEISRPPSRLRLAIADWLISEGLRLRAGAGSPSESACYQGETL